MTLLMKTGHTNVLEISNNEVFRYNLHIQDPEMHYIIEEKKTKHIELQQ